MTIYAAYGSNLDPAQSRRDEVEDESAGEIPSPLNPPSGCRFHPRCEHAMRICAEQSPPQLGTHATECWLLDPKDEESRRPLDRAEVSVADEA